MATETLIDPRKQFTPRILPWLLAVAVFVIYALTLNHWVSLFNLGVVAKTSGWTWQAEMLQPVFYAVTYPFRWLPAAQIPVALNLFSAVCAALTLGLLARSVAILPHDRTEAQRQREGNDFLFLTIGSAWLPPVFAVAVCGLQMTFWEHATNCTGEMFDLLLFAFVIRSLLEYRLDESEGRLFLAAVVYGAGMTNNWAMVGFFPVFIAAIIWIRGLSFFNSNFLLRMMWCGLAGMLFYLLLPLVAAASHATPVTFWQALKLNLTTEWSVVKLFFTRPEVRFSLALLSPAALLPVLVLAIRWRSSFGDNSRIGQMVANFMFHSIHALLLFVCVWVAFDPPISPRNLINLRNINFAQPFLTFYYLGALSVGYFSGYFLLVFGKPIGSRSRRRKQFSPDEIVDRAVVVAVWLFVGIAATGLAYKNLPQIRGTNDDTFKKFAALTVENLPRTGGIVLSDDWRRLLFAQAALVRDGRAKDFVLADTAALPAPAYHHYLHKQFPDKWPDTVNAAETTNGVSPLHLIGLLAMLAKTNELYYLHPSFGYYFELFYLEPHGLVYKLNLLPNDTLLPPLLDKNLTAANETFWAQAEKTVLDPVVQALAPRDPDAAKSFGEQLLNRFHVAREPNPNATFAGIFYSRSLNFWGVQQQRAGDLTNAAAHFELAKQLNPDNIVAGINLKFNASLRDRKIEPVNLARTTSDKFGKYRSWNEMLNADGPFDDASFCFRDGIVLAGNNGYIRQAVAPLERVSQVLPDDANARLWLAQCYLTSRLPDRALAALREPPGRPRIFPAGEVYSDQFNLLAAAAYFQKDDNAHAIRLIETEISRQPTNDALLVIAAQMYVRRGMFTNAIVIIDHKLRLTPDDPNWLFGKGFAAIQIGAYNDAIAALTHLLAVQTNSNDARFNRAVAYLQSGNLDAARTDYLTLQHAYTNSVQVAYGLGDIAARQHDTNEAVRNFKIYLANAPTNSAEYITVRERFDQLRGK